MNVKICAAILLCALTAEIGAAASGESGSKKHRRHHEKSAVSGSEIQNVTLGKITIDTIYNCAHHRVLVTLPNGKRTFIFPNESRKVAALFQMMNRKDPSEITVAEMEKEHCIVDKGDHSYLLRLTPDGLSVHRVRDSKEVTKGNILWHLETEDTACDLLIRHVGVTPSKTDAFSMYKAGELLEKMRVKDARSSGSVTSKIETRS